MVKSKKVNKIFVMIQYEVFQDKRNRKSGYKKRLAKTRRITRFHCSSPRLHMLSRFKLSVIVDQELCLTLKLSELFQQVVADYYIFALYILAPDAVVDPAVTVHDNNTVNIQFKPPQDPENPDKKIKVHISQTL